MKILIIGFSKMKYMPYMNFYLDNINLDKNNVHIVFWNRDGIPESLSDKKVTYHEFKTLMCDDIPRQKKIFSFLKFRKYTIDIIKKGNFDFIIVFHSLPAILFLNTLTKHYKNKYIFDYRDISYEAFKPFKSAVAKLVENAKMTFISSDAFREFLPDSKNIMQIHNISESSLLKNTHREKKSDLPISISFWGFIRHTETNIKIIDSLANDKRFILNYYGKENSSSDALKKYCSENNVENVFFHGEYSPEERFSFAENTQIIHNIYDNNVTRFAMGNKYYDGLVMHLPQICTENSFMGKTAEKAGVGITLNVDSKTFANDIYNYYKSLDINMFNENCDKELNRILDEYKKAASVLDF